MNISEKLTEIAENQQGVYDAGLEAGRAAGGYNEGLAKGIEQGKEAENRAFWDAITQNQTVTDFRYYFRSKAWTTKTFRPPYPLKVTNASYMFYQSGSINNEHIKSIDFSECGNYMSAFHDSGIVELGTIDCHLCKAGSNPLSSAFATPTLKKIGLFITPNDKTVPYSSTFHNCKELKEILISGLIYKSVSFQYSPLSRESLINIMEHCTLEDPITITFLKSAVDKAFETSEGANDGSTSEAWEEVWKPMGNITIQYV